MSRTHSTASSTHSSPASDSSHLSSFFQSPPRYTSPAWLSRQHGSFPKTLDVSSDAHPFPTLQDSSPHSRPPMPHMRTYNPYHLPSTPENPPAIDTDLGPQMPPRRRSMESAPRLVSSFPPSTPDTARRASISATPGTSRDPFGRPSPPLSPWRDVHASEPLPPIRHPEYYDMPSISDSPRLSPPRRSSHSGPSAVRFPIFGRSPAPPFPPAETVTISRKTYDELCLRAIPMSRYEYPSRAEASTSIRDSNILGSPFMFREGSSSRLAHTPAPLVIDNEQHRHISPALPYDPIKDGRQKSTGLLTPSDAEDRKHRPQDHERSSSRSRSPTPRPPSSHDATPANRAKPKFGRRKGSRFFCTYVSPTTGPCALWDKGWSVYATLMRHAEVEHAPEELRLLGRGALTYATAQIVDSRETHARLAESIARTEKCADCGTVFSSRRRDSLARHKKTSACVKAQKRGRPPTKFPKKPKGGSLHISYVSESGSSHPDEDENS